MLRPGKFSKWERVIAPEIDWNEVVERSNASQRRAEQRHRVSPLGRREAAWSELIRPCGRADPCACAIATSAAPAFCNTGVKSACGMIFRGRGAAEPDYARRCRARPDAMHRTLREVCVARANLQHSIDQARSSQAQSDLRKGLASIDRLRPMMEAPAGGEGYYRKKDFRAWWSMYCASSSPEDFRRRQREVRRGEQQARLDSERREQAERRKREQRERRLDTEPPAAAPAARLEHDGRRLFDLVGLPIDDDRVERALAALGRPTMRRANVQTWSSSKHAPRRIDYNVSITTDDANRVRSVRLGARWPGRLPYGLHAFGRSGEKGVPDGDDLRDALGRPHAREKQNGGRTAEWSWTFGDKRITAYVGRGRAPSLKWIWAERVEHTDDRTESKRAGPRADPRTAELAARRSERRRTRDARIADGKAKQAAESARRARLGADLVEPGPLGVFDVVGRDIDDSNVTSRLAALGAPARSSDTSRHWEGVSLFGEGVVRKVVLRPKYAGRFPYGLGDRRPIREADLEAALGDPLTKRPGFGTRVIWIWRFGDFEVFAFFDGGTKTLTRLERRSVR
ncbi:MAG: hypothetical protein RMA76_42740 [Deltaproteobacteria bacterium]